MGKLVNERIRKITAVCHCVLNPASKVLCRNEQESRRESIMRNAALGYLHDNEVGVLQLPCPEFTLYGPLRWGFVREQADNVFFRAHCRRILEPVVEQLCEYAAHPELFEVLGVVGIDGSPSCGINKTCSGDWFGEPFAGNNEQRELAPAREMQGSGVFMEELIGLLNQRGLTLPVFSLQEFTERI